MSALRPALRPARTQPPSYLAPHAALLPGNWVPSQAPCWRTVRWRKPRLSLRRVWACRGPGATSCMWRQGRRRPASSAHRCRCRHQCVRLPWLAGRRQVPVPRGGGCSHRTMPTLHQQSHASCRRRSAVSEEEPRQTERRKSIWVAVLSCLYCVLTAHHEPALLLRSRASDGTTTRPLLLIDGERGVGLLYFSTSCRWVAAVTTVILMTPSCLSYYRRAPANSPQMTRRTDSSAVGKAAEECLPGAATAAGRQQASRRRRCSSSL